MRTRLLWTALVTALVAVGAWVYYTRAGAERMPAIATAPVTRGDVVEGVDATGTLQAVTTVQVGTQVSGTIKALHADFNSRVRRGQVIAHIDPSVFETQVEQARASLARLEAEVQRAVVERTDAQQRLRRARELAQRQLIAAADLEAVEMNVSVAEMAVKSAEAQVVQARASLHQNEVNLAHTIITAPIDGIVISRNVDVGQTVAASMQAPTLFVIARDLREMQVEARIAESDIGRIRAGQSVAFRVDAYPADVFTGTVSQVRLQPVVEQNVVSYTTIIDVPNPDLRLKPGMTANVTVETARAADVLRVPNAALRVRPSPDVLAALGQDPAPAARSTSGGEPAPAVVDRAAASRARAEVWAMVDGRIRRVPVGVGITDGTRTAIYAPELEGATVVTSIATEAVPASTSPLLPALRGRGAGGSRGTGGARSPGT